MNTENPFSRDDLKVVYHCEESPEACDDCREFTRCNFVDEFGLKKRKPEWVFLLSLDLLKDNMRGHAQEVLTYYLSNFAELEIEKQLRGILEGLPQTADLWRSMSTLFRINQMERESRLSSMAGLETHPRSLDLYYTLTKGDA